MLKKITNEQFDEFYQLLSDSFPIDEFRPYAKQKALLSEEPYQIYIYEKNEEIAALFATWEGPTFIFIEHFAVSTNYRNGGIGSKLLQELISNSMKPVILEIENPETDIQKRRVNFYERNGFLLNEFGYPQPALAENQNTVPLVLMSYPKEMKEDDFIRFKQ